MFTPRCKLLLLAILLSLYPGATWSPAATSLRCTDSPVVFELDGISDFKCLCSTVKAALDFLESIGLKPEDCTTIRLVDHVPSKRNHTLIGKYDSAAHELSLLTYEKAVEAANFDEMVSDAAMREELWCSFAAHELAHAVSYRYLAPHITSHTAAEYISAVTQISVLSPRARQELLDRYADIEAYQSRREMSELYFLMAPNKFAVKCYRHFLSLENPREFIDRLLKEGNGH